MESHSAQDSLTGRDILEGQGRLAPLFERFSQPGDPMHPNDPVRWIGFLPFAEARKVQQERVTLRAQGQIADEILLCEHPPTLTLGMRSTETDLGLSEAEWTRRGVQVARTDRGGRATFHGPGQLMIYPIFSLPSRSWGVRRFVEQGLGALSEALNTAGIPSKPTLEPAGLWSIINGRETKLASVGLRIRHGISDHGFSMNLLVDLRPFSWFTPCGLPGAAAGSIHQQAPAGWQETLPELLHSSLTKLCNKTT